MSEAYTFICIICPRGCEIKVETKNREIIKITGNQCARGIDYVEQEIKEAKRVIISVIKVKYGDFPTVSVKTDKPIPKKLIPKIMKKLAGIEVEAPIKIGQRIIKIENVTDNDVYIVATRPVKKTNP